MSEVTERRVHGSPKRCALQLSFKRFIGNVWIAQLDRQRIPQMNSGSYKCSVAVNAECSWYSAGWNVDGPQRELCLHITW